MATKDNYIHKICQAAADQCQAAFPGLHLHFIIHPPGQLASRLPEAQEDLRKHPAYASANLILQKTPMMERSSLLGIAMKTGAGFLGLGKRHHFLALININTDDVDNTRTAQHLAYHLAFHAIDLMFYRLEPKNLERFSDGPMIPKRSPMNMAFANMKADLFAASVNTMHGYKNAIKDMAAIRATQSITAYRSHRVENYPYVVAVEAAQYALSAMEKRGLPSAHKMIRKAHGLANDLAGGIEEKQISQWQSFASPAQNMAWAGHSCEEILGAAVNTSENPYIRATGYLVAEYAGITPLSASTMMSRYNSFTSFERNERLHRERMEHIFEAALSKSLHDETGHALSHAAHNQNENLAEGSILGWCASGLQVAGKTFDSVLPEGKEKAATAARHSFQRQEHTSWDGLIELNEKIIEEKRNGYAVTLNRIVELCEDNAIFAPIRQAVQQTLNDPAYQAKIQTGHEFIAAPAPHRAPRAAAPRGPAPTSPAPVNTVPAAPAGPALGGSSAQMVRARELMRQKRLAEQQAQESQE